MNTSALRNVMNEARKCAAAMLESGTYIERELPNVRMDEPVRVATVKLCSKLIGTKHDIIHELFELDELLASGASDERIKSAIARIIDWLGDDIRQMHELVTALDAAAKNDPTRVSAYLLVAGSAVNILNPFNRAAEAADLLAETRADGNTPRQ
jgi:hypothetical protein